MCCASYESVTAQSFRCDVSLYGQNTSLLLTYVCCDYNSKRSKASLANSPSSLTVIGFRRTILIRIFAEDRPSRRRTTFYGVFHLQQQILAFRLSSILSPRARRLHSMRFDLAIATMLGNPHTVAAARGFSVSSIHRYFAITARFHIWGEVYYPLPNLELLLICYCEGPSFRPVQPNGLSIRLLLGGLC